MYYLQIVENYFIILPINEVNMQDDFLLEKNILDIAYHIYKSTQGEVPSYFDIKKWKGKIMSWAMHDDLFRVQLLKFIDVLPVLKKHSDIIKILKEYFTKEVHTPKLLRWALNRISKQGFIPTLVGKIIRSNVENLSRQFITGSDPESVYPVLKHLWDDGYSFTIDLLGEAVLSDYESDIYKRRYIYLLKYLKEKINSWNENNCLDKDHKGDSPRIDLSIKLSAFYSQMNPMNWEDSINCLKTSLRELLREVMSVNASLTFDMEHYYFKDLIIETFKSILLEGEFSNYQQFGIALQTYLVSSEEDLISLISWVKENNKIIKIRLVKGAYYDYEIAVNSQHGWEIPVFKNKADTDAQFERLTKILLENTDYIKPAIASHNIRSISNAVALVNYLGIDKHAIEFQFLYGMAESIRTAVKEMGYRTRVYTPVGELLPGMAYFVRRILENTSNESVLRQSFVEKIPFENISKQPILKFTKYEKPNQDYEFYNHPLTNFSKNINRQKMYQALDNITKSLGKKYPLLINGKKIYTDEYIPSNNPDNPDEIIGYASNGTADHFESMITHAQQNLELWKTMPGEDRAKYLFKAAREMERRKYDLMALEVYEVGKSWAEADGDITEAIDHLNYYGKEMVRLSKTNYTKQFPGEYNQYIYSPKGIALVISPWNFPLAIPTGMVSAALVTGNCVILKPSSLATVSSWQIIDIFETIKLPKGVLQYITGKGDQLGNTLISHPKVDLIAFTGSKEVGLNISCIAGDKREGQRNIKKVIAEMGGKNAIIVDETADLDEAILGVLHSAFGYQGQKCSACSRAVINKNIFEDFTNRLLEAVKSIQIGSPSDPKNFMGPVIDQNAMNKINKYIQIGESGSNKRLSFGVSNSRNYISPTIFADIKPDSPILREEIFGPVLTLIKSKNINEAIKIANDSEYALTAGLFSRSPENISIFKSNIQAGNIYINRKITGAIVGRQPFGGYAMSGIGSKAGGPDYLIQFMNPISICENTLRRGYAPVNENFLDQ